MTTPILDVSLIDIRTFRSYQEIQDEVKGFVVGQPITTLTYARIVGDYNFAEEEVKCCVEEEHGNLCGEKHKRGWVARLNDGSATILGNHCAELKFGMDSKLISDTSQYSNEKKRRERVASVAQLITEKETRLARLSELLKRIKMLEGRVKVVTDPLGPLVQRRLKDMIRTGRGDVAVTAIKKREFTDETGRRQVEKSKFVHVLGTLAALELASPGTFDEFYKSINDIVRAYHRAQELVVDESLVKRSREVEHIAGRLQNYDRVIQRAESLTVLERAFFANNFILLCFLTDSRDEQIKAAKVVLRRSSKGENMDQVEDWIAGQKKAVISHLKVDAIEIK